MKKTLLLTLVLFCITSCNSNKNVIKGLWFGINLAECKSVNQYGEALDEYYEIKFLDTSYYVFINSFGYIDEFTYKFINDTFFLNNQHTYSYTQLNKSHIILLGESDTLELYKYPIAYNQSLVELKTNTIDNNLFADLVIQRFNQAFAIKCNLNLEEINTYLDTFSDEEFFFEEIEISPPNTK